LLAFLFLKLCLNTSHLHMTAICSWLFPNETQYSENPASVLNLSVNKFWSVLLSYYVWPQDLWATKVLRPIKLSKTSSRKKWLNGKSTNVSKTETGFQHVSLLTVQPTDTTTGPRKIYWFTCHERYRIYKMLSTINFLDRTICINMPVAALRFSQI